MSIEGIKTYWREMVEEARRGYLPSWVVLTALGLAFVAALGLLVCAATVAQPFLDHSYLIH